MYQLWEYEVKDDSLTSWSSQTTDHTANTFEDLLYARICPLHMQLIIIITTLFQLEKEAQREKVTCQDCSPGP